ncbi:hypothetical protein NPIL_477201 [Nephila pilipes]|uniref:Uncharacterized protein n=1 Tax=Nephila pilipes TaxID=299642 RepID=A0A8X6U654_NEPPI|nr:hypothetical protein NPIL_477201 [Nephila pilipes]
MGIIVLTVHLGFSFIDETTLLLMSHITFATVIENSLSDENFNKLLDPCLLIGDASHGFSFSFETSIKKAFANEPLKKKGNVMIFCIHWVTLDKTGDKT